MGRMMPLDKWLNSSLRINSKLIRIRYVILYLQMMLPVLHFFRNFLFKNTKFYKMVKTRFRKEWNLVHLQIKYFVRYSIFLTLKYLIKFITCYNSWIKYSTLNSYNHQNNSPGVKINCMSYSDPTIHQHRIRCFSSSTLF